MQREEGEVEARIKADTVAALKAGDKRRAQALRLLTAALKKERIDSRHQPSQADEFAVLGRERKRRQESAEVYEQAGRADLLDQETYEAQLIEAYLPAGLSEVELTALVDQAITAVGATSPREMGKVMAELMPKVAGRADGKLVSATVRQRLGA